MSLVPRRRAIARVPVLLLLAFLPAVTAGCATSGGVEQTVTIVVAVDNDLQPSADAEIFLYPYGGDTHDRYELGVVRGASEGEFRVTVPTGRYVLAARGIYVGDTYAHPIPRPVPSEYRRPRRFNITLDTRRVVWLMRAGAITVEEGGSG